MLGRVLRAIRTPLTLLILLGLLVYGAYWGWTKVAAPPPPPPQPTCVPQKVAKGELKADQVTVNVYNGGKVRGLAGQVARDLQQAGFQRGRVSNTKEHVTDTVVVGASKTNPEVKLVAGFFKKATIRADHRKDGSVDVLVGDKFGGFNAKAKTSVAVKTETVCLPPSAPAATKGS